MTVATIPNGLTNTRSAVMAPAVFFSSIDDSRARTEVPNGTKTSVTINKNTMDCFAILCIFSSLLDSSIFGEGYYYSMLFAFDHITNY